MTKLVQSFEQLHLQQQQLLIQQQQLFIQDRSQFMPITMHGPSPNIFGSNNQLIQLGDNNVVQLPPSQTPHMNVQAGQPLHNTATAAPITSGGQPLSNIPRVPQNPSGGVQTSAVPTGQAQAQLLAPPIRARRARARSPKPNLTRPKPDEERPGYEWAYAESANNKIGIALSVLVNGEWHRRFKKNPNTKRWYCTRTWCQGSFYEDEEIKLDDWNQLEIIN